VLVTRWVPTKGFRSSPPPFPGFAWRTEKELKGWRRSKKIALIQKVNPQWSDLSRDLIE
jgi:hypothetical protein